MREANSISVVIPTLDETWSLIETLDCLENQTRLAIVEYILVVAERTKPETIAACRLLASRLEGKVKLVSQVLPGLGGAFRAGIARAMGSHIVLMFADLESDPGVVSAMHTAAVEDPMTIISASRWIPGGGFVGCGKVRLMLNHAFQRVCSTLTTLQITDFSYGFRMFPVWVLQSTDWKETDHAFVIESLLIPAFRGVSVREVPAVWTARRDGVRRCRFWQYARYLPALFRIMAASHSRLEGRQARDEALQNTRR